MRTANRSTNEIRELIIKPNYTIYAEGSVLITLGETIVLCNATIEETVPNWIKNSLLNHGWITAEYSMLPRSTLHRINRERLIPKGRTQEISRFVGRSLRAAVDLEKLGNRTCTIDCDVIQADGGTRTAAVTGGYVALAFALSKLIKQQAIPVDTIKFEIAAISCGILGDIKLLDLDYEEDKKADLDANVVMNSIDEFIEVQLTAEGKPISHADIDELLRLSSSGIKSIIGYQQKILNQNSI